MPKKLTQSSRFQSRYGGGWVSAAQWLAEAVVERHARKDNVDLPPKFWQLLDWQSVFLLQVRQAYSLLKLYDIDTLCTALKRCPLVYSLHSPQLLRLLKSQQFKQEINRRIQDKLPDLEQIKTKTETHRPAIHNTPSLLNRLRSVPSGQIED